MKKILSILSAFLVLASLGLVSAAPVEKIDGFVCPVMETSSVLNSPNGVYLGDGRYAIIGTSIISIPMHVTNDDSVICRFWA